MMGELSRNITFATRIWSKTSFSNQVLARGSHCPLGLRMREGPTPVRMASMANGGKPKHVGGINRKVRTNTSATLPYLFNKFIIYQFIMNLIGL